MRLTAAGLAAVMDGANRGTREVQIRRVAIGSGLGPGDATDDARTTLRTERARADAGGTTAVAGRIAVTARFAPTATYSVTEVGVIARIGNAGAEFLFGYHAVPAAAEAVAAAISGSPLVVSVVVNIRNAAAVTVTIDPDLTIQIADPATTTRAGIVELATPAEVLTGTDAERAVTPLALAGRCRRLPLMNWTSTPRHTDISPGLTRGLLILMVDTHASPPNHAYATAIIRTDLLDNTLPARNTGVCMTDTTAINMAFVPRPGGVTRLVGQLVGTGWAMDEEQVYIN